MSLARSLTMTAAGLFVSRMTPSPLRRAREARRRARGETLQALGLVFAFIFGTTSAAAQSFGPPTPGVCFLSKERVLDQSNAGAAANQRIAALRQAVEQELSGERQAIANDSSVLQIQKPVIDIAVYQQRAGALALREQAFQNQENTRNDQLARTRADVTAHLIHEMAPILAAVLSEHKCSAVLESSGAYAFNPNMDLTSEVIGIMNNRLPAFPFDLDPPNR
jgi:Skp family chaperone for outer membrane proteins